MSGFLKFFSPTNRTEWIGAVVFAVALSIIMVILAGVNPDFWVYLDPEESYDGKHMLDVLSFMMVLLGAIGGFFLGIYWTENEESAPVVGLIFAIIGGFLGWLFAGTVIFKFAEFWVYAQMPRFLMLAFWAVVPAWLVVAPFVYRRIGVQGITKGATTVASVLAIALLCRGALTPFGLYFWDSLFKLA